MTRVAVTQDVDWDPTVLDSRVPEEWYKRPRKPLKIITESMLDEEGLIKDELTPEGKDDLPEEEEQHREDRKVSRSAIRVHLAKLIRLEEVVNEVREFDVDRVVHERDIVHRRGTPDPFGHGHTMIG